MANIYGLGPRYDLSPAAMAQLAGIAGAKPPPPVNPPPPANPATEPVPSAEEFERRMVAGMSPEEVAAQKKWEKDAASSPSGIIGATNPTRIPGWTPEGQKQADAKAAEDQILNASNPNGPANDNFPGVRQDYASDEPQVMPSVGPATPAHWQQGTHEVTTERSMDPASLDQARDYEQDARGQQLLAHDRRQEAAMYAGAAASATQFGKKMADDYFGAKLTKLRADKDAYVDSEMTKLNELVAQSNVNPDPKQYWKDKGTFGSILGAIAVGLGQFGASMTGGPNTAYQIIKDGIDRSVRAQEAKAANARALFGLKSTMLQKNLEVFGDKERAILATKIQYLDNVTDTIKQGHLGRLEAGARGEAENSEFLQKFYEDRARLETEFAKLTAVKATEKATEKFVPASSGVGAPKNDQGDLYVPTLGGFARDPITARELNKKGAMRTQILENMHQIHNLLELAKTKSSLTSPLELDQINDNIQALIDDSLTKNTQIEGQGAMSEGDKVTARSAKNLAGIRANLRTNGSITRMQERVRAGAQNILTAADLDRRAYGIRGGTEKYRQGPTGPVPVQQLEGRNPAISKQTTSVDYLVAPPKGEVKKNK